MNKRLLYVSCFSTYTHVQIKLLLTCIVFNVRCVLIGRKMLACLRATRTLNWESTNQLFTRLRSENWQVFCTPIFFYRTIKYFDGINIWEKNCKSAMCLKIEEEREKKIEREREEDWTKNRQKKTHTSRWSSNDLMVFLMIAKSVEVNRIWHAFYFIVWNLFILWKIFAKLPYHTYAGKKRDRERWKTKKCSTIGLTWKQFKIYAKLCTVLCFASLMKCVCARLVILVQVRIFGEFIANHFVCTNWLWIM